jgi:hypothetical protein
MKKIAVVPIDDRPICYTLIEQIAAMDKNLELFMPERNLLGNLKKHADYEAIFQWLNSLCELDAIVLSLDTIAYGGLISSRRNTEKYEEIIKKADAFLNLAKSKGAKIYAFSSIMRISNNNENIEEKKYWNLWGEKIFRYSYEAHKGIKNNFKDEIPKEILNDYLKTRERNFKVNLHYLEMQKKGMFDFLIFSKDDTGQFGLNVKEAQEIEKLGGFVKTGADEIPLGLFARAYLGGKTLKIKPIYKYKNFKTPSKYEDIAIDKCARGQIEAAGCEICEQEEDLTLFINNFKEHQGDHVLGDLVNEFNGNLKLPKTPYFIADVNNANGADNTFVEKLFEQGISENFFGYCAYNTSANTVGCALCVAIVKHFAECFDKEAFLKLQFIRFVDDWAYQANVRQNKENIEHYSRRVNNFFFFILSSLEKKL